MDTFWGQITLQSGTDGKGPPIGNIRGEVLIPQGFQGHEPTEAQRQSDGSPDPTQR